VTLRRYPIPRGTPSAGALNTRGWGKLATFDGNRRLSRKEEEEEEEAFILCKINKAE